jgi:hypothetical protein
MAMIKAPLPAGVNDTPELRAKLAEAIAEAIGEQKALRFRLVSDDSGHQYSIPQGLWARFGEWLNSYDDDFKGTYEGPDFNEFRLNSHISNYTYTDLQEVK